MHHASGIHPPYWVLGKCTISTEYGVLNNDDTASTENTEGFCTEGVMRVLRVLRILKVSVLRVL